MLKILLILEDRFHVNETIVATLNYEYSARSSKWLSNGLNKQ